jgi:hypothetical protein
VVFVGTVAGSAADRTNLLVEAWYLGPGALGDIVVVGGRQPGVITSADWTPAPGEQYAVVVTRNPEGTFTTATCEQAPGHLSCSPRCMIATEIRCCRPSRCVSEPIWQPVCDCCHITRRFDGHTQPLTVR